MRLYYRCIQPQTTKTQTEMINSKGYIFFLLFLSFSAESTAQTNLDSLRRANEFVTIPLDDIVGTWYSSDSVHSEIHFIKEGDRSVHIGGIEHGVGSYYFTVENDHINVNGSAANWPPYYCILSLVEKETLEIKFYQYFDEKTHDVIFGRD